MTHSPQGPAITNLVLPGIPKLNQGKVREIFSLEEDLLIVATDRISAFDVILPHSLQRERLDPTFSLLVFTTRWDRGESSHLSQDGGISGLSGAFQGDSAEPLHAGSQVRAFAD